MAHRILYRNVRARDYLDIFLVSAISSLLLLRFYLYIAGYPQVGGGALHIAHMLWGGVFMLSGLVMALSFLGQRIKRLIALVGGVGFGVFIDELGKFITRDNNYFFKPTIGIIYAVFAVLYLIFSFLSRRQLLTSREYQLNALAQLEEAIAQDLDDSEKKRVLRLLDQAEPNNIITKQLRVLLNDLEAVRQPAPKIYKRLVRKIDEEYQLFWQRRTSNGIVRAFFAVEAVVFVAAVLGVLYNNIDNVLGIFYGQASYSRFLVIGQLVSTIVAAGFAIYGIAVLQKSRSLSFEYFRRAALINLLLTGFFEFCRQQFGALPGFALNLAILIVINFVLHQEVKLSHKA